DRSARLAVPGLWHGPRRPRSRPPGPPRLGASASQSPRRAGRGDARFNPLPTVNAERTRGCQAPRQTGTTATLPEPLRLSRPPPTVLETLAECPFSSLYRPDGTQTWKFCPVKISLALASWCATKGKDTQDGRSVFRRDSAPG